jgi:hypothetical protein
MEIVVGILLYSVPLVLLGFVARDRFSRLATGAFCLLASLVGEVSYLILLDKNGLIGLATVAFWKEVVVWYPIAILPLGMWAACLGVVGTSALRTIAARRRVTFPSLLLVGLVAGAVVGLAFMGLCVSLARATNEAGKLSSAPAYVLAGIAAGAACGGIAVLLSRYGIEAGREAGAPPPEGSENRLVR